MDDSKLIKLFIVAGMCFCVGNGLDNKNFLSLSGSFRSEEEDLKSSPSATFPVPEEPSLIFSRSSDGPCTQTQEDSSQDDCTSSNSGNIQSITSESDRVLTSSLRDGQGTERGDEISGDEVEPGEYHITPGGNEDMSSRLKRYPEHLDPTRNAFFPFWLRVGECPVSSDGLRQHFCPTPTKTGKWVCIDDYQLCDGMKNCPNAEDESSTYCMFFKSLKSEVDLLTRTVSALRTAATAAAGVVPPSADGNLIEQYTPITANLRKYENVKFPVEKWIQ